LELGFHSAVFMQLVFPDLAHWLNAAAAESMIDRPDARCCGHRYRMYIFLGAGDLAAGAP
jgi:hypothetical protein